MLAAQTLAILDASVKHKTVCTPPTYKGSQEYRSDLSRRIRNILRVYVFSIFKRATC